MGIHEFVWPKTLSTEDAAAIAQLADARGMTPGDLIREWVREKLHAS